MNPHCQHRLVSTCFQSNLEDMMMEKKQMDQSQYFILADMVFSMVTKTVLVHWSAYSSLSPGRKLIASLCKPLMY